MPIASVRITPDNMPNEPPFFALSYSFAPRFCPTKVDIAIVKLLTGKNAKPSILACMPYAATANSPYELIFD